MSVSITDVEAKLLAAITYARSEGLDIAQGEWGVSLDDTATTPIWVALGDCLCPMACVILSKEEEPGTIEDMDTACARELGCSPQEVSNFVVGFDGAELLSPDWRDDEFYRLGKKLRQQMVGGQ